MNSEITRIKIRNVFFVLIILFPVTPFSGKEFKKDIHYFIKKGWEHHSSIKQAEYDKKKYKYLELEAWSVYTPKVNGMTWIAPLYGIKATDDFMKTEVDFNTWAPFYHLDLLFQQPLFAFTRVITGVRAAREGKKVAGADIEIVRWNVAKEVRTYYYGIIFAHTLLKTIDMADDMLSKALEQAEKALKEGKNKVSEVDIFQLKYYYTQIPINRSFAEKSMNLAQAALFLATGEKLDQKDIPHRLEIEPVEIKEDSYYTEKMFSHRPLYKKLRHGINATRYLMQLEFKSMIPVLFAGGYIKYNIAPGVTFHQSKFLSNNYNTFGPEGRSIDYGFAFGFVWNFDPLKAVAKGLQRKSELDKLKELHNFALEGFPIQLKKTVEGLGDLRVKIENQKEAIKNSQSWMFFAANAYAIGSEKLEILWKGWQLI